MTDTFTYARFWRCALQVNTFDYARKHRGTDHGLHEASYNQAILDQCMQLSVKVVGIADHGSFANLEGLRDLLAQNGIVVFPGFEISSTEKIHMVCLFPAGTTKDQLNRYLGALGLTDVQSSVRPSGLGCLELAKRVFAFGGFWYAAHATNNGGILKLQRDGGGLPDIWKRHDCVRAIHIPGAVSGLDDKFRKIVQNENPDYKRERPITVINAKDVAKPEDLAEQSATCWIKMTQPTFDAFKVAFLDPESRIRLNDDMRQTPHGALLEMKVERGHLGGLRLKLSEHLNAVIGGRGTGKSTLIELIRYALDVPPKGKEALKIHQDIVKANLGKESGLVELDLRSAAQNGRVFTVSRRHGEPPIVRDDAGGVSQLQPHDLVPGIEIFGQNEIYELAQDPESQRKLLERFVPVDHDAVRQHQDLRKRLQDNMQKLNKALDDHDALQEQVERLPKLNEQLQGFQALGVEAKLSKLPLFTREKQLVERVNDELRRVDEGAAAVHEGLPDLAFLSDKALEGLPNAALLVPMRQALESLQLELQKQFAALDATIARGRTSLEPLARTWSAAVDAGQSEIEDAVAALPDLAGKRGAELGTAYRRLVEEIERIKPLDAKRATLVKLRATLEQERKNTLAELSKQRSDRANGLLSAIRKLNKDLQGQLRIRLEVERDRKPLKDFLTACKLDGVGEKRLAWIEERDDLTPLALAQAIRAGLAALVDTYSLTASVAEALAKLPRTKLLELESLELSDRITIELNVAHRPQEHFRELKDLSIGQKCTAILHLLLLDNSDPLIVDQPEDNLDNAFIAERIVDELRRRKTDRQFLFSTHNANIPVFGDAEWIGVFHAQDESGLVTIDEGSIDVPAVRDQVATILEGGRDAFMQRKDKYDY